MMNRAVLDACVLLPVQLCDLLLRLAQKEVFMPLWSQEILDEIERNLHKKLGISESLAAKRIQQMSAAFALSKVDSYEILLPLMTNDVKDRHVLAASVKGEAQEIVAYNLKDFPPVSLPPGLKVSHPDNFLSSIYQENQEIVHTTVFEAIASLKRPSLTFDDYLAGLRVLRLTRLSDLLEENL